MEPAGDTLHPSHALAQPHAPDDPLPDSSDLHAYPPATSDGHDQPIQSAEQPASTLTPAMQVRMSLLRRVWAATVTMQGVRRRRLTVFGGIGVAQLIAWTVILALYYHAPCDRPLALYLLLTTVRIAISFPLSYYCAITPRPLRRGADEEARLASEASRLVGSALMDQRIRFLSDLVSIASFILFIVGNFWMVSSSTCSATAPHLYNAALAALVLSWLWTAELVIYVILVVFFLPFFLIGMRFFGLGQAKNEIGPLSKTGIEKLPQRIYIGTVAETVANEADPSKSTETLSQPTATAAVLPATKVASPRRQFWRLWRRPAVSKAAAAERTAAVEAYPPFPAGVDPIRLPESQTACSICLCEYELPPSRGSPEAADWEPELLRLLPCGHALHSPCLDEWLRVSGRCPLCQKPVEEPAAKKGRKRAARPTPSSSDTTRPALSA
ncbi:hypothetical protein BMF94_3112 [Rhodotorula taiwanensis]|uniref:RING-type E3 ubiquitin transferase n=1 Tax=Rhodotorula taiwanensis TaxID=741276 RepID=A0A2S5B9Y8_9BASI|nr:hypothetical protein BMF94_3112 [Rhodotorula taiwanensis]